MPSKKYTVPSLPPLSSGFGITEAALPTAASARAYDTWRKEIGAYFKPIVELSIKESYVEQMAKQIAIMEKNSAQFWCNFLRNSALDKMDKLIEPELFMCQMQNADWRGWGGRYVFRLNSRRSK
jgi:hypothetical protein